MSAEQDRDTIEQAILSLAAVCDRAATIDGHGFNGSDAPIGHAWAEKIRSLGGLPPTECRRALKLLRKYTGQLAKMGIALPESDQDLPTERYAIVHNGTVMVYFSYNRALVDQVKEFVGRSFRDRPEPHWEIPLYHGQGGAISEWLLRQGFYVAAIDLEKMCAKRDDSFPAAGSVRAAQEAAKPKAVAPKPREITIDGKTLRISFEKNAEIMAAVKSIPGRDFNWQLLVWEVSINQAARVLQLAKQYNFSYPAILDTRSAESAKEEGELMAMSRAVNSNIEIPGFGGPGRELRPYQRASVEYLVRVKKGILGDEVGLGKTAVAQAVVQYTGSYPCVVVCPATLKFQWQREIAKWLPGRKSVILDGRDPEDPSIMQGVDFVIVNYEILSDQAVSKRTATGKRITTKKQRGWGSFISKIKPAGLIVDEAHMCKGERTKRSKAILALAKKAKVVLLLTGTLFTNRPVEGVMPLTIVGRIGEFGGAWAYKMRYCGAENNGFGWSFKGATNVAELNQRLRQVGGYTRHLKRDKKDASGNVIERGVANDLPEKMPPAIVPLPLESEAEYRRAESDVAEWFARHAVNDAEFRAEISDLSRTQQQARISKRYQDAEQRAKKAQALVRFEALKMEAVRQKMPAMLDWIRNFIETGEKLIVFAWHKEVVERIAKELNAPFFHGGTSQKRRDEIVSEFQDNPNCPLLVVNIQAGGTGLNLTAASNVAIAEMPWNPAAIQQAFGRIDRLVGQDAKGLMLWYLLAADTIDEELFNMIEGKRVGVEAATDGNVADGPGLGTFRDLLKWLESRRQK